MPYPPDKVIRPLNNWGLAPVVQRPDNFIQWIRHYSTVSICAKITLFPHLQANMHILTTAKFGRGVYENLGQRLT